MRFGPDTSVFWNERNGLKLRCPNFEAVEDVARVEETGGGGTQDRTATALRDEKDSSGGKEMGVGTDVLRLHFFRDLTAKQRVEVLIAAGVLPASWTVDLTHVIEARLWERALETTSKQELGDVIARLRAETVGGEAPGGEE